MTLTNIHPWLERLEHVADLYPTQVVLPGNGRVLQRARVWVYRSHVFVVEHNRMAEHPEFVAAYPLKSAPVLAASHLPRRHQQSHLETNHGPLHIQMLPGCRCGNELTRLSAIDVMHMAAKTGFVL